MPHDPALTFAIALLAGIAAQSAAQHLRVPGIVLLLATGVLLGPDGLGLVHPDVLGEGLEMIVGLAVAVILFEGGLSLHLKRLRSEARTIRRLVTLGAVVTAVGGAVAARVIMGWDARVAILFGTLVTVTGPTVITPLLRRIRVTKQLGTILEAEGVLIDPIGAILAVVTLEVVLSTGTGEAAAGLLGLPTRLAVGTVVGAGGGLLIGVLLRPGGLVPEGYENIFTLACVLALFEVSEALIPESGILSAAVAGLTVANMRTRVQRELKEFKEQLTVLLVGLLFVLLAADVRVASVFGLGVPGLATVLVLMLVVRPLNVALCTAGSELGWAERLFLSWVAPRGIVAAAVASLFARRLDAHGLAGGGELLATVFLLIAATVIVQGMTSGLVASALGVRRPENRGFVLVGANPIGRALARALMVEGEDVVLIDANPLEALAAEEEGLRVVFGNANDARTLLQADIEGRLGFAAVTPNEGVNLLLATRALEQWRVPRAQVALLHRRLGVRAEQVHEAGASVLFGRAIELAEWSHDLERGQGVVEVWTCPDDDGSAETAWAGSPPWPPPEDLPVLPLVRTRNGQTEPVDDATAPRKADRIVFAWRSEDDERVRAWLAQAGWRPAGAARAAESARAPA